jgi:hypothetical protein
LIDYEILKNINKNLQMEIFMRLKTLLKDKTFGKINCLRLISKNITLHLINILSISNFEIEVFTIITELLLIFLNHSCDRNDIINITNYLLYICFHNYVFNNDKDIDLNQDKEIKITDYILLKFNELLTTNNNLNSIKANNNNYKFLEKDLPTKINIFIKMMKEFLTMKKLDLETFQKNIKIEWFFSIISFQIEPNSLIVLFQILNTFMNEGKL